VLLLRPHGLLCVLVRVLRISCGRLLIVGLRYSIVAPIFCTRQHTSAHVSIRQHTSAYFSTRQPTSAYVGIHVGLRYDWVAPILEYVYVNY
jgi:hypothetical protein